MEPGIFAKTFVRPTLAEVFDAVAARGIGQIQFSFASAGLPALPREAPLPLIGQIRQEAGARRIGIAAVSATFNMIHPDPAVRAGGLASLRAIAAACPAIGAPVVTLCSGTRDPDHPWRDHPGNARPDAWRDLLDTLTAALAIADDYGVTLGVEPEPGNVVRDARHARDLLDEMGRPPRLGIILDPANIIAADRSRTPKELLAEAFALLGERIVLAHAKDLSAGGEPCAAGTGIVPWDRFIAALRAAGFDGPLILHGLSEAEVPGAVAFLRERIAAVG